jgi:hypothetical protein
MYHAIVKQIARKNFERVNQKDFDALLKDCVPDVHHRFYGSHALSGERHDREALAAGSSVSDEWLLDSLLPSTTSS